jgi:N12 class adenine-specific DNA methylase
MGKQRLTSSGYDVLSSDESRDDDYIKKAKLDLMASEAAQVRKEKLDQHLLKFDKDPVSQSIARADFIEAEREAARAARKKELDTIAADHSDPIMKLIAVGSKVMTERDAPSAQKAFAEQEGADTYDQRERQSRALDKMGMGNAVVRETAGAAIGAGHSLAGVVARAKGDEDAADQLARDANKLEQAKSLSRSEDWNPYISGAYGGAAQSLIQSAATPGGAISKIIGSGVMSGNEALTTAKDAGLDLPEQMQFAATQGLLEAGIALIGQKLFGAGIESRLAGQAVASNTVRQLVKHVVKDTAKELPEEVITTALQDLSSKYQGVSPDMTLGDFIGNAADTVVQTIIMGGLGNVPDATKITKNKLTSALNAFRKKPSTENYKAAVDAGLPPIDTANRKGRAEYADTLNKPIQVPSTPTPVDATGAAPEVAPTAPVAPMAPTQEAPSGEVVSAEEQIFNELERRTNRNEDATPQTERVQQVQQEGRQEGLLTPAGTPDSEAQPTDQTPAALTQESFAKVYEQTRKRLLATRPSDPRYNGLIQEMADLFDQNPQLAEQLENEDTQPPSVVGQMEVVPDQPLNPPAAGSDSSEPPKKDGFVRVYHSGSVGDGTDVSKRWVSTNRNYAANYRPNLPLFYTDVPADDPRVNNPDFPEQGVQSGFTFNFELTPEESSQLREVPRKAPVSSEPDAIQYHSGLSRSPADMDESIKANNPVGVSAYQSLTAPMRKKLVEYANADGKVFVDSGAFTAFRKGQEIDWDRTLFAYHELLTSVSPDKRKNMTIVAPDIVGDHDRTMELQYKLFNKFTPIIELGGQVIVPVQKTNGGGKIWTHWADATDSFTPEQNEQFIVGVPFNESAWTQDDVLDFMRSRQKDAEFGLRPFHLLGAGPSKVQALFEAAQAEGLSLDGISADAMPKKISQRKRPSVMDSDDQRPITYQVRDAIIAKAKTGLSDISTEADIESAFRSAAKQVFDDGMTGKRKDWFQTADRKDWTKRAMKAWRKSRPKSDFPAPGRTLQSIVLSEGGISAKSLRKDYNQKELKSSGLLRVMRIASSITLDEMASMLENAGHLRTPPNRTPADWLMEQLQNNADSALANYSDKEIEAQLKQEQEQYEQLKETLKAEGIDTGGLEDLRQNSIEAGFNEGDEISDEQAQELIDVSFDFGANVAARAGDIVEFTDLQGKTQTGLVTKVRSDGRVFIEPERRKDNVGRPTSTRYEGMELRSPGEFTKVGTSPFPATLNQFYSKWEGKSEQEITAEFTSLWDSLDTDDKGRLAGRLRKFGINAKVNNATDKLAAAVAERLVNSRDIPGKIREVYDIAMEYPNLQGRFQNSDTDKSVSELMMRIDAVGLTLPPMVRAAMILPEARRELLHDLAKTQFGEEIADTLFSDVPVYSEDDFKLERPKAPKKKAEDFGTNPNTKQGGLFDAGKPDELPGQNLLFDSDPGDVGNPKTQENKAKATAETPPADSQPELSEVEQATLAELMTLLAPDQTAVKPQKKPRAPKAAAGSQPTEKKPRSKVSKKISKAKAESDAEVKALYATFVEDMKSLKITRMAFPGAPPVMNPKAIASAVRLTAGLAKNGILTFAEFASLTIDNIGAELATTLAPYLETAWTMLQRVPGYEGVDAAGRIVDFIGVKNENEGTDSPDKGVGRKPRKSRRGMAGEAGSAPEDGQTEGPAGQDSNDVPSRTASTETDESGGTGNESEGAGAEQGSGVEQQSGQKPAKPRVRKPSKKLPRRVEGTGNLRIQPDDVIAPTGVVGKLKANIAAIKLLKALQADSRNATPDEQRILMQYTGWGSLQNVFDENRGEAFIKQPGLKERYGEWYEKAKLYQKPGAAYESVEDIRKRVESWEKQWGDSYVFLKENLTKEEWNRAAASTLNAHFTSRDVITNGIWGALERMGVSGGRFLEPSAGIGSLIGLMPEAIANNSDVVAIELDKLTGEMVKQLYPDADVYVTGFEDVPIPVGTIDVAATNVPFHQKGPADAKVRYGRDMNLHNYFIARILDSIRPGGVAAVITTHFTMDANPQDREFLAGKADLVGAIRLPNSAFKANAGTEVTTDILFFRKPDGTPFKGQPWLNMKSVGRYSYMKEGKKGKKTEVFGTISVNEYFHDHPEMVLGTHSMDGEMYSGEGEYTVIPTDGAKLADQLQQAVKMLPAGIADANNSDTELVINSTTGTAGVDGRIEFRGSKLVELSNGEWIAPAWLKQAMTMTKDGKPRKQSEETRVKKIAAAVTQGIAYTRVRNAYEIHLANMRNEKTTDEEYLKSQKTLNVAYDAYVEKHGALNDPASSWLENDPGFFFTSGLENEAELIEGDSSYKVYSKADIFTQRTVNADKYPTSADSTAEALKISLAWKGHINLPWMAELTGVDQEDLQDELLESGFVFLDPANSLLEPADTYLAGNVHAKLRAAEQAVKDGDKRFERNVEFLKKVQPAKVTIDAITPSLGAPWVPIRAVQIWLREKIGVPATVRYNERADIWSVDAQVTREAQNEWGTLGMHLTDLLPRVLNNASIRVMKPSPDDHKKSVLDEAQTQATQVKAEKLRESFVAWAKSNEAIIPDIEQAFNEQKNFYVKPKYDGSHMSFPGMSDTWLKMIRPYQKDTIWRAIREGRGMIAHGVGAGKTLELIATAMEMKRLGIAQKPLIVVQNSTLGQFARTFNDVYPSAKVLVATNDDLNPDNRARFMAKIATGNWDSIVMAKSTFNMKVPNDPALEQAMMEGLIDELKQVMLEAELADGKGAPSVKAIQQQINSLQARLEKVIDRANAKTDKDVYFEQMGIDALFLDEAHDYKKPPFVTKIDRSIKGLATDVSQRALSALIKLRFVQDNNRGRNTFMATGTPITNTLGESWLLMNMIAPDVLREFGVETFDRFVATFASISTNLEPNPVGKLQRVTRLAKFKNGHQLAQFIQSGWDVLLGDELHEKIREYGGGKIPKMQGGQEMLHLVDRSPAFEAFGKFFLDVYDAFKALTGDEKRMATWVPLSIYGAAKAAAIDVRLVDPTAPDDPGSKLNRMVEGVYDAWVEGTNVTLMAGDKELTGQNLTQLIFSDTSGRRDMSMLRAFAASEGVTLAEYEDSGDEGANGASDVDEDRWLYQEIKRKLIAKGIPAEQIQLITDHNTTPEKLLAFQDAVSAGKIRIAIGHSDTLGTGVNVQPRLKDLWELDIPMVPAKREQRIGRIIRSGNMNEEVRVHVMAMQKSLDGTLMAMNLRKAKASVQALSGKAGAEFDDPYSESLMSMADMEAAMNDDPLFYRQKELEHQIRQMRLEVEALDQQRSRERQRLRDNESRIQTQIEIIAERASNADRIDAAFTEKMPFVIEGEPVATLKEADAKLKALFDKESARISKLTQDSRIPAIQSLTSPKADHIIADVEFGPMQFTLVYGERPVVDQDEKGVPFTKWVETSGTIITMNKQIYDSSQATRLSTVVNNVQNWPKTWRSLNNDAAGVITHLESENQKLKDFLGKPSTAQVELDNLESQLSQVSGLMFQRDNPGAIPRNPPGPDTPVTQEQMPAGYELVGPETDWTNGRWFIMAPGGFTITPGGAATPQDAYAKAQTDPEHGDRFPTIAAPAGTPDPATQPAATLEPEATAAPQSNEARIRAEQARRDLEQLRDINSQYDSVIAREWRRIVMNQSLGSAPVLSKEMNRAIAGRMLTTIKVGVKQFEIMLLDLRAMLDDETIRGIKDVLVGTWNAIAQTHGLTPTTPEEFDKLMTQADEPEFKEVLDAVEAAADPDAANGDNGRFFSTQNAFSEQSRRELGEQPRRPVERESRLESTEAAKEYGSTTAGQNETDLLIAELVRKPRVVSPYENDLLNVRNAQLSQRLESALTNQIQARRRGDDVSEAKAQSDAETARAEKLTLIERVLEPIGTLAGRALQARKAVIDEDFTLQRLALEYEAAYGEAPSTEQLDEIRQQIDELNATIAELQQKLDEEEARANSLEEKLKEATEEALQDTGRKRRQTKTESARARSRDRVNDVYQKVSALLGKTYSDGKAVADALSVFSELAVAYADLGVVTVQDFINRVRKRMGPDADALMDTLREAWDTIAQTIGIDAIVEELDTADPESIGRVARSLHRFVIARDGLDGSDDGRKAAVRGVYEILADLIPGITEDEVARAMSGIGIYSPLTGDQIDAVRRDQKAQLLLLEQIDDWKRGQAPPATGSERPPVSGTQRALRKLVNEAKKAAGIVTGGPGQLRSALDAAKRLARNRIEDLTKALESGNRITANQKVLKDDGSPEFAELNALREERDELQKRYDEAFGRPELSDEQRADRAEKALDRAIAGLEADLASGKLYSDAGRPAPTSEAIEAKKAKLEALKASRDEMRLKSGEAQARSDAAFERYLRERDAKLATRLAEDDFKPKPKKPAREFTPEMRRLQLSIEKQKQALNQKRDEWEFSNQHPIYRALIRGPVAGMSAIRKILTTLDNSLIGRQGYVLGLTHPKAYGKASRKAFANNPWESASLFPTEQDLFDTVNELDADVEAVALEKIAKLAITGVHGGLNREEGFQFAPEWANKIPGVAGSERAGSAFINTLRRLTFRSMVDKLAKRRGDRDALTAAELRVIGNMVNVATGRGNLGQLGNASQAMAQVFFSPRWMASRLQWWIGQPLWHESRWFGGEGVGWDVRRMAAIEWGKQMMAQAIVIGTVAAALTAAYGDPGEDEEWEFYLTPNSPNFGKFRISESFIDMTAGLGQHMALFARLFSGKETGRWETTDADPGRIMGNFARGKLAPVPSMVVDYFMGKSISGDKVMSLPWLISHSTPLITQDVYKAFRTEEKSLAAALTVAMFFGLGAQSREAKTKSRSDLANSIRTMKKQGKADRVLEAVQSHLEEAAINEAQTKLKTANENEKPVLERIIAGDRAELADAVKKERFDIAIRASEDMASTDGKGVRAAVAILKEIAPNRREAEAIWKKAYISRYGSLTEFTGGRTVPKKAALAALARLKKNYGSN